MKRSISLTPMEPVTETKVEIAVPEQGIHQTKLYRTDRTVFLVENGNERDQRVKEKRVVKQKTS